jgi:hypothetical protein
MLRAISAARRPIGFKEARGRDGREVPVDEAALALAVGHVARCVQDFRRRFLVGTIN